MTKNGILNKSDADQTSAKGQMENRNTFACFIISAPVAVMHLTIITKSENGNVI